MREIVIAGNWKMNQKRDDVLGFVKELKKKKLEKYDSKIMIFTPSIYLKEMKQITEDLPVIIGCQNMHQEKGGAYTGEISAKMIKSIGIETVLIGHSERRQFFNETDKIVNMKLTLALEEKLKPILCIGETLEERKSNVTNQVLETQITKAFENIEPLLINNVIIAYEPVWAIGTGETATAEQAQVACSFVRSVVSKLFGTQISNNIIIQYGGSVNPENIKEIIGKEDIDGALVGGASLEVESFLKLL